MGRLLITNQQDWHKDLDQLYKYIGFPASFEGKNIHVYRKRYVNNTNTYFEDDRMVACVGTWAYKMLTGKDALKQLFIDYFLCNMDVKEIRANIIGTYACCLKSCDSEIIFVDETHTYALYYFLNGGRYIITNTFYHIEREVHQDIDTETFSLILAKTGLSSNKTPFENIYRLMEDEAILIKNGVAEITKIEVNRYNISFNDRKDIFSYLSEEAEKISSVLSSQSNKKFLFISGGADSRLRLALDLKLNKQVELGYWKGSDVITNGTDSDTRVNGQLAKYFDLKTNVFDVSEEFEDCINSITAEELDKYGEYVYIYAHNSKWLKLPDVIKDKGADEIELGYDPDILRPVDDLDKSFRVPYSIDTLIKKVFLRTGIFDRIFKWPDVYRVCYEDIEKLLKPSIDKNNLSIEDATNIFNYSRLTMGNDLVNYFNEYFYCYPLMYCRKLWDIIASINYEFKKGSHLSVFLTQHWSEHMMDIPVFSHNHFMKYDKKRKILRRTYKHAFLAWLKPFVINSILYDKIYIKYFQTKIFPENSTSARLFQQIMNYLSKIPVMSILPIKVVENASNKGFGLDALGSIVAKIKFLDVIYSSTIKKHNE